MKNKDLLEANVVIKCYVIVNIYEATLKVDLQGYGSYLFDLYPSQQVNGLNLDSLTYYIYEYMLLNPENRMIQRYIGEVISQYTSPLRFTIREKYD